MFRGLNAINLDTKGRMAIPKRYRNVLEEQYEEKLVITIDTEFPCLLLYPFAEWELIERKLESLPSLNRAARRIQHLLIGHATEVDIDGNGRILIPNPLRHFAKLEKQVVLVGQGSKFEIWSDELWEQHRSQWLAEEMDDELPQELQKLSL